MPNLLPFPVAPPEGWVAGSVLGDEWIRVHGHTLLRVCYDAENWWFTASANYVGDQHTDSRPLWGMFGTMALAIAAVERAYCNAYVARKP